MIKKRLPNIAQLPVKILYVQKRPIQVLYGLITSVEHYTAPYDDIIWFNNVCPTLHSSL